MPANLTAQYYDAEKKYKAAQTNRERLQALKQMLAMIPKHKGTDKLQGDIKRKIARLKEDIQHGGKGSKQHFRYHVEKEGLPQFVLVGPPNVGKSQLLANLTNAHPEIANYPFTTRIYQPGITSYLNFHLQMVDLPAISANYMEFWIPDIIKRADGLLLIIVLSTDDPLEQLETTVQILKDNRINLTSQEIKVDPYQPDIYLKTMIVGNKSDHPLAPDNWEVLQELYEIEFMMCPIAAKTGANLNEFKKNCIKLLNLIRVYSKPPGKVHSTEKPFIFKKGCTLADFTKAVHHVFSKKLKYARVWGATKFNGQKVNRNYVLTDEDIIELHL